MFQRPDAYSFLSFPRIGKHAEQRGMEGRAVIHMPQVAEFVTEDIIDERQGKFDKLCGERDFSAHGTASPAAFQRAYREAGKGGTVLKDGAGLRVESGQPTGKHEFCQAQTPGFAGGFDMFRGVVPARQFEPVPDKSWLGSTLGRNERKAERPAEEENGPAVTVVDGRASMFEEEVLFFPYPVEAGAYETQDIVQRNAGRSFDIHGTVGLHREAQGAAIVALKGEDERAAGKRKLFWRGRLPGRTAPFSAQAWREQEFEHPGERLVEPYPAFFAEQADTAPHGKDEEQYSDGKIGRPGKREGLPEPEGEDEAEASPHGHETCFSMFGKCHAQSEDEPCRADQ